MSSSCNDGINRKVKEEEKKVNNKGMPSYSSIAPSPAIVKIISFGILALNPASQ